MSKLYTEYLKLKNKDNTTIYLFKSGIFYIALNEDATKISELFDFKITNLNDSVTKCGFPQKRLEYYTKQLSNFNIPFEVIDLNYSKIENYSDYLNNMKTQNIIQSIMAIDMNNISFKESFEFLDQIKKQLQEIYN